MHEINDGFHAQRVIDNWIRLYTFESSRYAATRKESGPIGYRLSVLSYEKWLVSRIFCFACHKSKWPIYALLRQTPERQTR